MIRWLLDNVVFTIAKSWSVDPANVLESVS